MRDPDVVATMPAMLTSRAKGGRVARPGKPSTLPAGSPNPPAQQPQPSQPQPIRLVMVESREVLGAGVRQVLDDEDGFEVVAQVSSPSEALEVMGAAAPDVILVNAQPAESSEADATRQLRRESPETPLVVLGDHDADASIVGAVGIGAVALVADTAEPAELFDTIRRAADGEDPLKAELLTRPDLVERVVDGIRDTILTEPKPANPLTARQLDVLGLVASGLRNKEIGEALDLTEQTVKNHLSEILRRTGTRNRKVAVLVAMEREWLVPPEPNGAS
jgi:DNA-binding NarL/FixJ family response regulator